MYKRQVQTKCTAQNPCSGLFFVLHTVALLEHIDATARINKPVSYTHLDVYKRQGYGLLGHTHNLPYLFYRHIQLFGNLFCAGLPAVEMCIRDRTTIRGEMSM